VLVQALTVKFGGRYSIVLTAAPPPVAGATPGPFPINAQLFSDGHYLTSPGTASVDYHNASLNAGSVKLTYSCSACNGGVTVNPTKGASYGATLGPLQVPASAGYSFTATGTVTVSASAAQFSATNSSSSLPYAVISTFPNLSIYEVDGAGGAGAALLGSFDQNG
jgi:hypothetical protein